MDRREVLKVAGALALACVPAVSGIPGDSSLLRATGTSTTEALYYTSEVGVGDLKQVDPIILKPGDFVMRVSKGAVEVGLVLGVFKDEQGQSCVEVNPRTHWIVSKLAS